MGFRAKQESLRISATGDDRQGAPRVPSVHCRGTHRATQVHPHVTLSDKVVLSMQGKRSHFLHFFVGVITSVQTWSAVRKDREQCRENHNETHRQRLLRPPRLEASPSFLPVRTCVHFQECWETTLVSVFHG